MFCCKRPRLWTPTKPVDRLWSAARPADGETEVSLGHHLILYVWSLI